MNTAQASALALKIAQTWTRGPFAGGCAICRAGVRPEALTALVSRIIELVTAPQSGDEEWLNEFMHDILTADFLGDYLRELVGPIPPGIIDRFGLDAADMAELFGTEEAAQ